LSCACCVGERNTATNGPENVAPLRPVSFCAELSTKSQPQARQRADVRCVVHVRHAVEIAAVPAGLELLVEGPSARDDELEPVMQSPVETGLGGALPEEEAMSGGQVVVVEGADGPVEAGVEAHASGLRVSRERVVGARGEV